MSQGTVLWLIFAAPLAHPASLFMLEKLIRAAAQYRCKINNVFRLSMIDILTPLLICCVFVP